MKKFILSLIITLVCIFKINSSNLTEYNSIAEVKTLNYQLFEDIGFDEEKINFVSRVIYSIYKKASSSVTNNSSELNIDYLYHFLITLRVCLINYLINRTIHTR